MIQIQSFFRFKPDWYRIEEARGLILPYYRLLRSVLKDKPHLRKCLTRCRHCQIYFFTHPRNAGRSDLGCPFGCRQAHRRKSAIKRSTAYYKTPEGKIKKRQLNARRNAPPLSVSSPDEETIHSCEYGVLTTTIFHIRLTTSLIEGRTVGLEEVTGMIDHILRQLSMDKGVKMPYFRSGQHNKPP